jgi:hypothetical protein
MENLLKKSDWMCGRIAAPEAVSRVDSGVARQLLCIEARSSALWTSLLKMRLSLAGSKAAREIESELAKKKRKNG